MLKKLTHKIVREFEKKFYKKIIHNSRHKSPDFFIIGAAKSGTTSLFHYLAQHPQIAPPKHKEPAFFSWNQHKGVNWYLSHFPLKKGNENTLTFEATPSYLVHKKSPKLIAEYFPNAKFIAILRDPIERAYSHWNFYHDSKFIEKNPELKDHRSFDQAVEEELSGKTDIPWHSQYLKISRYDEQIEEWRKYFTNEKLLFLDFDELKRNPKLVLSKITKFLEIIDYYQDFKKANESINYLNYSPSSNHKLIIHNSNLYKINLDNVLYKDLKKLFSSSVCNLENMGLTEFDWIANYKIKNGT